MFGSFIISKVLAAAEPEQGPNGAREVLALDQVGPHYLHVVYVLEPGLGMRDERKRKNFEKGHED